MRSCPYQNTNDPSHALQRLGDSHMKALKYKTCTRFTSYVVSAYGHATAHCILSVASDSMEEERPGQDVECSVDIHHVLTIV